MTDRTNMALSYVALVTLLLALLITAAVPAPAMARPLVALFDILTTEGVDKTSADDATKIIKEALRDSGKADILQIRPDAPSMKRAVAEGRIKESEAGNAANPELRPKVAAAIGAHYALGGALSMKDGQVAIAVEMVDIAAKKSWQRSSTVKVNDPPDARNISSALTSAANTVAADIGNDAFGASATEKPAITAPQELAEAAKVSGDGEPDKRAGRAQEHLKNGNIPAAIYELRRAIQSNPKDPGLRVLLADAYTRRSLFGDAQRELNRAIDMDPQSDQVIQGIIALYEAQGVPEKTIAMYEQMISKRPEDVRIRLQLGDLLWRKARVDDAIKVYEGAAALDAKNIGVLDRLARCRAAKSQFDESLKYLDQITKLEDPPDPAALSARYTALMVIVEAEIKSISNQFDQGAKAFENQQHTREQYYELIRGLTNRADTLTGFLDKVASPPASGPGQSHRVLACSLLSQAGSSLMSFLETNKDEDQTESQLYLSEAKKELALAAGAKLTPTPSPAPTPSASAPAAPTTP